MAKQSIEIVVRWDRAEFFPDGTLLVEYADWYASCARLIFDSSNYFMLLLLQPLLAPVTLNLILKTIQKHKIEKENFCVDPMLIRHWDGNKRQKCDFFKAPSSSKAMAFHSKKKWLCFEFKARMHGLTLLWLYHLNPIQCDLNTESNFTCWNPMKLRRKQCGFEIKFQIGGHSINFCNFILH